MNDKLQVLMDELMRSGWQSNPAMTALVNDYAKFHAIFVVATSVALLVLVLMSAFCWARSRKIARTGTSGEVFERRVFRSFAFLGSLLSLAFALLITVNADHAFNPSSVLDGFSLLSAPRGDSAVGRALLEWIESNAIHPPLLITQKIHDRVSWQGPKAIICGVLLILFVAMSVRSWDLLLKRKKRKRATETNRRLEEKILFGIGTTTAAVSLLMLIMVIANTQGALAPLTITVLVSG
jgi:hypothetical protein